MIEIKNISKRFDDVQALDSLTMTIPDGEIMGIVGTNGAGKSTLLRLVCGILRPDRGQIMIDGMPVYENRKIKESLFYISDDAAFIPNGTADSMADFYRMLYPTFSMDVYKVLMESFHMDRKRQIRTYSKGMKKTLMMVLGISAGTRYLLCDESFDGLDAVMRQAVKETFAGEMKRRSFTPVIATHNLREIDDICDRIGQLHEGKILVDQNDKMMAEIHKVQYVMTDREAEERLLNELKPVLVRRQGSLTMITVRGAGEEIMARILQCRPLFCEEIPLNYEEIFISETEAAGYEIKDLIH